MTSRAVPAPATRARRAPGFTLIEAMVTLAIVALLAAVALPAYLEQVARGKRADAQTVLVEDAAYLQRFYAANNAYTGSPGPSLPASQSPRTGAANYAVSVASAASATFSLQAVPQGSMANDRCGTLTYDNLGSKGAGGAGQSVQNCWR